MTCVALPQRMELVRPDEPIDLCYFVEFGVASVTSSTAEGRQAEIGVIGREGMVDVAVVLGSMSTPFEIFVQIPGEGYAVPAADVALN